MSADPPIITPETRLRVFRNEIYQNITDILALHRSLLASLFVRQKDQHPLVSSIADIELDWALKTVGGGGGSSDGTGALGGGEGYYEAYIKNYPIAISRHRRETVSNKVYAKFMEKQLKDPRLKKRGLVDFLSRPVTRIPRISLILEQVYKLSVKIQQEERASGRASEIEDADGDGDEGTMPLTLSILSDFVKSTEPGVHVADAKVRFWALCESLVYRPGEIIVSYLTHQLA